MRLTALDAACFFLSALYIHMRHIFAVIFLMMRVDKKIAKNLRRIKIFLSRSRNKPPSCNPIKRIGIMTRVSDYRGSISPFYGAADAKMHLERAKKNKHKFYP